MVDFKQKLKAAARGALAGGIAITGLDKAAKELERRREAAKPEAPTSSSSTPKNQSSSTPIQNKVAERRTQTQSTSTQRSVSPKVNMSNQDVKSMIVRIAQEEGVDPALALSIAHIETGGTFNPNAIGDNGNSFGLFQIHKPSHPDYKGGLDPEANTRYGLRMFKGLLDRNGGSVNKAVWAYNAGQGNLNKGILPSTTKNYINMMASLAPQYRQQGYSSVAPVSPENRAIVQSMGQGNSPQQQPRIDVGTTQKLEQAKKPTAVTTTPELDNLKVQMQALNDDPRNASLTIPSMYDRLVEQYAQMNNQIQTQDPRYQGDIIPAQGYYLDPEKYKAAMWRDKGAAMLGASDTIGGNAKQVLDEANMMYQINMANQAGVPYADYQAAMLDRQKAMVSSQAAQIESELKMALANEDNVFKRQQLLQMIEQNGINAQNELNNLDYQIQNNNMVEQYKAQQNINLQNLKNAQDLYKSDLEQKRKMQIATYQNKLDMNRDAAKQAAANRNPYNMLGSMAAFAGYDPRIAKGLLDASGMGRTLFPDMTPELANAIYGNTPSQPSQGGILDRLRQFSQGNNGGLQANEY